MSRLLSLLAALVSLLLVHELGAFAARALYFEESSFLCARSSRWQASTSSNPADHITCFENKCTETVCAPRTVTWLGDDYVICWCDSTPDPDSQGAYPCGAIVLVGPPHSSFCNSLAACNPAEWTCQDHHSHSNGTECLCQ